MKKISFKDIAKKIRTDKKTKMITAVSCCVVVAVILVVIAVGASGNSKIDKAGETTTSPETITVTAPPKSETAVESTEPELFSETSTAAALAQSENTTAAKQPGSSSAGGKTNSNSGAGKSSSGGSGSSPQKTPPAPIKNNDIPVESTTSVKNQWTQAEVDTVIADAKIYAKSKGFTIDGSLGIKGTSWRNPATTESDPERVKSRVNYCIDDSYDGVLQSFGHFVDGATINILAQQYTDSDGYTQWEIYVVY